jgi:hypothetical protein
MNVSVHHKDGKATPLTQANAHEVRGGGSEFVHIDAGRNHP